MKRLWITGALCLLIGYFTGAAFRTKSVSASEVPLVNQTPEASDLSRGFDTDAASAKLEAKLEEALRMLAKVEAQRDELQIHRDALLRRESVLLAEPPGTSTKGFDGEIMDELLQRHQRQVKRHEILKAIRDGIGLDDELSLGIFADEYFDFNEAEKQGIETALNNLWSQIHAHEIDNSVVIEETPEKVTMEVRGNPELVEAALAKLREDLRAAVGSEVAGVMLSDVTAQAFRERWSVDRTITFQQSYPLGEGGWNFSEKHNDRILDGGGFNHAKVPPQYEHLFTVE